VALAEEVFLRPHRKPYVLFRPRHLINGVRIITSDMFTFRVSARCILTRVTSNRGRSLGGLLRVLRAYSLRCVIIFLVFYFILAEIQPYTTLQIGMGLGGPLGGLIADRYAH